MSQRRFLVPVATAIMRGLSDATVLTIFFVPALYAAWFEVARTDINGNVQCAGGCRDGSAQFCDRPTAAPGTAAAR